MLVGEPPFFGTRSLPDSECQDSLRRRVAKEARFGNSPELAEIVLQALERDPLNRYHDARELAWDLEHQDQIATGPNAVRRAADQQGSLKRGRDFPYLLLALIPLAIFALLLYVASH